MARMARTRPTCAALLVLAAIVTSVTGSAALAATEAEPTPGSESAPKAGQTQARLPACRYLDESTRFGQSEVLEAHAARHEPPALAELPALGPRVRDTGRIRGSGQVRHLIDRATSPPSRAPPARRASHWPCARHTGPIGRRWPPSPRGWRGAATSRPSSSPRGRAIPSTSWAPRSTSRARPECRSARASASRRQDLAGRQQLALRLHHVVPEGYAPRLLLRL